MSELSANLALPYLAPAQAQKHVTHNEALTVLDAVVQLAVLSRSQTAPPTDPAPGARYILPAAATGVWSGQEAGALAFWDGVAWRYFDAAPGWRAFVLDEAAELVWQVGGWQAMPLPAQGQTGMLGVNAAPDATNRLAVSSAASLLSHEGAGHQLKINKAAAGDTGSLLFQTGWSGRAEMGCAGSDDFALKVSEDGASWVTALQIDGASGHLSGAAVQASAADVTPGRLARADYAYGPGNLLGSVSQVAGVPGGAVIERGSTANGAYLRFADGTQMCMHAADFTYNNANSLSYVWSYPAAFAAVDACSIMPSSSGADYLGNMTGQSIGGSGWGTGASPFLAIYRPYGHPSFTAADALQDVRLLAVGRWY